MVDHDVVRQVAVAAAIGGGFAAGASGDYRQADRSRSVVRPADYAFSIWGPVYAGVLGHAVNQARPTRRSDPLLRRTGWPAAFAVGLSGAWIWAKSTPRLQELLIVGSAAAAWCGYLRAAPADEAERESTSARWLVRAPLGLFTGWITLASVAATAEVLIQLDAKAPWVDPEVWGATALTALAGCESVLAVRRPVSAGFPVAVAWGLAAVAVRNLPSRRLAGMAAAVGAVTVAFAGLTAARRVRPADGT